MKKYKEFIMTDLYRAYGNKKNILWQKIKSKFSPTRRYMMMQRKAYFCKNRYLKKIWKIRLQFMQYKTYLQIPMNTKIGKGFYIEHFGRIIINAKAVIGDNVNIATGVIIGSISRGRKTGEPVIGNEVWIGANSVIVGKVKIGNNVLIAPNTYVNFDVPDNSIVIGSPGVIHYNEDATKGYIRNKI